MKFSDFFIILLIAINVLPILAPIFMSLGLEFPAKVIYFIYSFFCHQIHWRSLHIHDHQCAWCARDMAIWGGLLIAATLIKIYRLKGIKWYQVLPFVIPIALDGGIQTIATGIGYAGGGPIYVSTNFMRMITGSIFGIGLASFMMPMILQMEVNRLNDHFVFLGKKLHYLMVVPITFAIIFVSYLAFIQLWKATSSEYLPSNAIDSAVKLPEDEDDWLVRRQNGICPVALSPKDADPKEALALECFF